MRRLGMSLFDDPPRKRGKVYLWSGPRLDANERDLRPRGTSPALPMADLADPGAPLARSLHLDIPSPPFLEELVGIVDHPGELVGADLRVVSHLGGQAVAAHGQAFEHHGRAVGP